MKVKEEREKVGLKRNIFKTQIFQETTVRTGHETMDWFQIGKGVRQGSILSP